MYTAGGGRGNVGGGGSKKVRALYDYNGENPTDLSFRKGDVITLSFDEADSGPEWRKGDLRGVRGSFPANYVEFINDSPGSFVKSLGPSTPSYNNNGGYNNSYNTNYNANPYNASANIPFTSVQSKPPNMSPNQQESGFNDNNNKRQSKFVQRASKYLSAGKRSTVSISAGGGAGAANPFHAKRGLIIASVTLFLCTTGLIWPWYFTHINDEWTVYQWDGYAVYDELKVPVLWPPTSGRNLVQYHFLKNALYSVHSFCLSFMMLGTFMTIVQLIIYYANHRDVDILARVIFTINFIVFLLLGIAIFAYIRWFCDAWHKDVNQNPVGPGTKFIGSEAIANFEGEWFPGFGWVTAVLAWMVCLGNILNGYLAVRDAGGFREAYSLD